MSSSCCCWSKAKLLLILMMMVAVRERESKTQVSARVREHLDGRLWSDLLGCTLTGHWTLTATLITATSATSVY